MFKKYKKTYVYDSCIYKLKFIENISYLEEFISKVESKSNLNERQRYDKDMLVYYIERLKEFKKQHFSNVHWNGNIISILDRSYKILEKYFIRRLGFFNEDTDTDFDEYVNFYRGQANLNFQTIPSLLRDKSLTINESSLASHEF